MDMRRSLTDGQAALLRALGHPARLRIIQFLAEGEGCAGRGCTGERCVCEIIPALGMEQSSVSKHLAILRERGVVESRREGTRIFYSLVD
ncbi:MAG: metalloregulator ArsR/SmtB family transcription factor, partial [Bacillota bacterium]